MANEKPLRVWPGVVAVAIQWGLILASLAVPDWLIYAMLGGLGLGLVVLLWWIFFSRAAWLERLGGVALIAAAAFLIRRILDPSIRTGMMGLAYLIFVIPTMSLALVVWAAVTRRLPNTVRRATLGVAIILGCGVWLLARTDGITGEGRSQLAWRWSKTAEQKLLAQTPPVTLAAAPAPKEVAPEPVPAPVAKPVVAPVPKVVTPIHTQIHGDWPGFRGPHRDGVVTGVRIKTDWAQSPPKEIWRRAVGPGWSSFAVHDGLIYTQEQRGESEVVACYDELTGKPVWTHSDAARFWESNGGPGPRATPTYHDGRIYTFGATGIANALDARTGAVVWTHNAAADASVQTPEWGFASSPLVDGNLVMIAASGRLVAYDLETGALRWRGPDGGISYSSPQLATIDGVTQVLLLSDIGLTSIVPADGTVLWKHAWKGYPIVQPGLTADGGVLISASEDSGVRRLAVARGAVNWTAGERWTSKALKPYFNDFVVHNGHAYGFDGGILSCIDLQDGKRSWKGGRYGHGQMILLADQDVLLVLSEDGELALVAAMPEQFTEIAKAPALDGKSWNHPVLAGDILLVRNGQEMAAFRVN